MQHRESGALSCLVGGDTTDYRETKMIGRTLCVLFRIQIFFADSLASITMQNWPTYFFIQFYCPGNSSYLTFETSFVSGRYGTDKPRTYCVQVPGGLAVQCRMKTRTLLDQMSD